MRMIDALTKPARLLSSRNMRSRGLAFVICAAILTVPASVAASTVHPVVTVGSGKLRGVVEDGVASWKGIPFAAPPVGPLRWRAPQPAARWAGVRDAVAYRNDCMQEPFGGDAAPLGTEPAEDCLYANVWRPADAKGKLPVVFWIYGGGFVNGGASPPTYSGANLARQGVLFFSFNYRLGRFGTFAHPQLTKADPDHGLLGNYGHLDQIAALKWVQRNIAAFGGDPANVTIIGESAGGMSVHTLVTSPLARGLFAKAVVMSGANGEPMSNLGLAAVEQAGVRWAEGKAIAPHDPQALAKLRALSAQQVTDGLNFRHLIDPKPGPQTYAGPFADGKIAVDAARAYGSGGFAKVPMLIGATDADIGGKTGFMVAGARDAAAAVSDKGAPVWAYRFSYVASSLNQPGAGHATEIPFFFNTQALKYREATTPRDNAIGRIISAYIVNFAKKGNPNGAGLPGWPRYDRAGDRIMEFTRDAEAVARKDPWGAEIDAVRKAGAQ